MKNPIKARLMAEQRAGFPRLCKIGAFCIVSPRNLSIMTIYQKPIRKKIYVLAEIANNIKCNGVG
jgi:hypothetical protein